MKPSPATEQLYLFNAVTIPQPDGSFLVRPVKPLVAQTNDLTVPEAAAFLKLSQTSVKWLCDFGHLQNYRATGNERGKRKIPRAALLEFDRKRREADADAAK